MAKFAKLIEIEDNEQVLMTINYNEHEEKYEVKIRTDIESCTIQSTFGYEKLEDAKDVLDTYTEQQAVMFRTEIIKMLDEK